MRECGDCIACCVYLKINDEEKLQKSGMEHCPFVNLNHPARENEAQYTGPSCIGNCSVIGTDKRPQVCGEYYCHWRMGHGAEEDRPDKSLILFDRSKRIENALEAKPLAPDQEITDEGRETIKRMSITSGLPVIVLNFYEKRIQRIEGRPVEG